MDPSKWTSFGASTLDQLGLFCFLNTHRCSVKYSLFYFFFSILRVFHPSVRLFTHTRGFFLLFSLFLSLFWWARCGPQVGPFPDPPSCYTHCRTQAYILLLHYSSSRAYCFLFIYIYTHHTYMYTYCLLLFLRVYIYIYFCETQYHNARTHTIAICVLVYRHTLHIYYIIVFYMLVKERETGRLW